MPKDERVRGATSNIFEIFIQNSGATNGSGLTGLVFNSASLSAYYKFDAATAATAITLANITTIGTFANNGFREVDATNMPGVYEFDPPNAAFSNTSSKSVVFMLKGATNMAPVLLEIALKAVDTQNATTMGIGSLPNATPGNASGGLLILGANNQAISFTAGMTISNAGGDALALTSSGSNGSGLNSTANGSGAGIKSTGGATGHGISAVGGATSGDGISSAATTSGHGLTVTGVGTTKHGLNATGGSTTSHGISAAGGGAGSGIQSTGGATGPGIKAVGGATSGDGVLINTTVGHGINAAPTGTDKHGIFATGGNGGTSDGIKAAAGTGGVDIRGNITGNITGTLATLTTYTGNTPQTGDAYARLGAPVGASVSVDIAAVKALLPTALVSGRMDSSVGAVATGAITAAAIADGAIDRATFAADTGLQTIRSNTAQAGSGTTITLDASASAVDNFYNNALVFLTGGTGAGQSRFITAYVGATKVATVATWATNPDNTTTFAILPFDAVAGASAPTAAQVATAVWQDLLSSSDFTTTNSIGKLLYDNIDSTISSRVTQASYNSIAYVRSSTAQSGNVASIQLDSGASSVDSTYIGLIVLIISGAGAGQVRTVQAYTGSTKTVAVVPNWTTAPDSSSVYALIPFPLVRADSLTTSFDAGITNACINAIDTEPVTVGSNLDKTGYSLSQAFPSNFSSMLITAAGKVTVGTNDDKTGYSIGTGGIAAAAFAANAIDSSALAASAANEIRDAVAALVCETQGSYTLQQILSIVLSALVGVTTDSGATFKTPNGVVTRIQGVTNISNERTSITLTP